MPSQGPIDMRNTMQHTASQQHREKTVALTHFPGISVERPVRIVRSAL